MANDLSFDILGTSFTITADEDEEYLKKVLNQYKAAIKNTQSISGINETLNVAILTGFLLCDEINKLKLQLNDLKEAQSEADDENSEVEDRTIRVISKLEHALNLFSDGKDL